MKILVTGAAGFLGSRVVRRLVDEGGEVHALLRDGTDPWRIANIASKINIVRGDVCIPYELLPKLREVRPDACLHLAWCAVPGHYLTAPENVELLSGTFQLARTLADLGCTRFVGVGTCFEYDTDAGWLHEDTRLDPRFLYAAAKVGAYLALGQLTAPAIAWARLFYLYGPGEDGRRLVPSVIGALLRNEPARCSAGLQVRDFLHVEDVASALLAILRSQITGAINVGSGIPVTVAAIALRIGELMRMPELVHLGAIPTGPLDPPFICADTRKLRSVTGWQPSFDLERGLQNTIDWWRTRGAST